MKNNIPFVLLLIVFLSLSCNSTKKISFIQRADQIDIMAENQLITSCQFDFQKGTGIKNPQRRNLTLKPGESALFKFRMTIYEGVRDKEGSDKDFKKFSKS